MLIAQASGPLSTRTLVKEQLQDWHARGADVHINANRYAQLLWIGLRLCSQYFARLRIYALLAGCAVWPEATAAKTSVLRGSRTLRGARGGRLMGSVGRAELDGVLGRTSLVHGLRDSNCC